VGGGEGIRFSKGNGNLKEGEREAKESLRRPDFAPARSFSEFPILSPLPRLAGGGGDGSDRAPGIVYRLLPRPLLPGSCIWAQHLALPDGNWSVSQESPFVRSGGNVPILLERSPFIRLSGDSTHVSFSFAVVSLNGMAAAAPHPLPPSPQLPVRLPLRLLSVRPFSPGLFTARGRKSVIRDYISPMKGILSLSVKLKSNPKTLVLKIARRAIGFERHNTELTPETRRA